MRDSFAGAGGIMLGLAVGCLFWALLLGVQIQRHEPGLWSLRAQRVLTCSLDYNGPPFTHGDRRVWLTCGGEDSGWQLWPVRLP